MLKLNLISSYFNQGIEPVVNSFFNDDYFESSLLSYRKRFYNIEETNDQYKISIDLPGYSQKEIQIDIENGILYVNAVNSVRGKIEKSLNLGSGIDQDNIVAKITDGVLEILINKINKRKKIDIQ